MKIDLSTDHLFLHCEATREVWDRLMFNSDTPQIYTFIGFGSVGIATEGFVKVTG